MICQFFIIPQVTKIFYYMVKKKKQSEHCSTASGSLVEAVGTLLKTLHFEFFWPDIGIVC